MFSERLEMIPVAPFRLSLIVWALRRRPGNIVDRWDGTTYRRVLVVGDEPVEISVIQEGLPDAPHLLVEMRSKSDPIRVREEIIGSIALLLGTEIDMTPFHEFAMKDPMLKELTGRFIGFKPPRFPSPFEALVNGIACQQVSLANGISMMSKIAARWGKVFQSHDGEARAFPLPADLARADIVSLRRIGLSFNKARALVDCTRTCGEERFSGRELSKMDDEAARDALDALRGVGTWTAEYVLLRGLGRIHIFPEADSGALNGLRRLLASHQHSPAQGGRPAPIEPERARRLLALWRPYAGLVYFHLLLMRLARENLLE